MKENCQLFKKKVVTNAAVDDSPGEEMALVEHLKGMSLTIGARREIRSLLISLLMLGKEDLASKLQNVCMNFQLSQVAAVKLGEDTVSTDSLDDCIYSLEHYCANMRNEVQHSEDAVSWQLKVLV